MLYNNVKNKKVIHLSLSRKKKTADCNKINKKRLGEYGGPPYVLTLYTKSNLKFSIERLSHKIHKQPLWEGKSKFQLLLSQVGILSQFLSIAWWLSYPTCKKIN